MEDEYKKSLFDLLRNKKLILASNRGPYSFERDEKGNLVPKRGGGGLVSAFLSLLADIQITWYSVAKTKTDKEIGLEGTGAEKSKDSLIKFIGVNRKIYAGYYNQMCNEILWFVQHGLMHSPYNPVFDHKTGSAWQSYKQVNKTFAKFLSQEVEKDRAKGQIILFQDYHLYLAAKYLPRLPATKIHFTHIPWPAAEIMSVFPHNMLVEILEGMLCNDLLGFHCQNYADNFLATCRSVIDCQINYQKKEIKYRDKIVPVKAFPISIDAHSLAKESALPEVTSREAKQKQQRSVIFRADRIDPSKNIIRGFMAFERLLEKFPQMRKEVIFVANLYESRNDLKYYQNYLLEIKSVVKSINERFGDKNHRPIHLRLADDYFQTLAAYKNFDVLLVNSIADGMNLVAKEGPLLNQKNGVVVLSNKTGACNELSHFCLTVNPFDIDETAAALMKALKMADKEKASKNLALKNIITNNNTAKWLYHQLKTVA